MPQPTRAAHEISTPPGATLGRTDWVLAAVGVALGLAAMAVDHLLGDDPGLEDPGAFVATACVILLVTALLFGLVVRRAGGAGRTGLVLAAAAVLSLPLIWLGLPFAVAPAAVAVGLGGRGRSATVAIVVGSTVLVLASAAYVYSAVEKLA